MVVGVNTTNFLLKKGHKMQTQTKTLIKGFKFRIYPTEAQKELLNNTFGCCRYVYNRLLAEAKAEYEAYKESCKTPGDTEHKRPSVSGYDLVKKLTLIKSQEETSWLNNVSSVALQQSAIHLGNAFKNFFKGKGYPKFKKKRGY